MQAQPCSSTPVVAGYRDFSFGSTVIRTPTAEKPESKLWYHDGFWWGSLWSTASNSYRIHRFNVASQCWENVGPDIDNRTQSLADALSDGNQLYIASHVFSNTGGSTTAANAARLYRYSYNSGAQSYSLDSGFPVTINLAKSESLVLAKDTAGKLWITWTQGGKVKINRSTTDDLTWGTAFDLPVQGGNTKGDDISSIIAFGGNKIGVMWSNQTDLKNYFAVHFDGNSDTEWQAREEALADASLGAVSDDHINLKMTSDDGGNIYAVTKTSLTDSNHPLIYLLRRTSSGVWSRHVVAKKIDDHTRPIVLIDDENRRVYVFAKSDRSTNGTIRMKSASLDDLVFPDGVGEMFIRSNTDDDINNPTSTKQNVNGTTDLVVLASDEGTRNYMHNFLDLPGGGTQFTLTTNVTPSGSGTVTPSGGTFNSGTQVQLTATPGAGWVFDHWSGDLSGSTNPATITMNSNKSVTANFVEQSGPQFTLTTNVSPAGSGTISLNPPGGSYGSGQNVTVAANPSAGWVFDHWSGDLSGSTNPESIIMNSNKNVTATFTQSGGGGQVAHEETITGGSSNSTTVSTSSSLTAAAGQLYLAAIATKNRVSVNSVSGLGLSWTLVKGQCAGRNQTGIEVWMALGTPSGNGTVTAALASAPNSAVIAVSRYSGVDASDPVGNVISGNTNGLNGACSGGSDNSSYSFNLTTTISGAFAYGAAAMRNKTHTPGAGYTEHGEVMAGSGGSAASVAVMDKTVSSPSTVAVNGSFSSSVDWAMVGFEIRPGSGGGTQFTLTTSTVGSGTVTPSGGTFDSGTQVQLTATPTAGWVFDHWSGDLSGSTNPATITMDSDKNITATFAEETTQFTLTTNTVGSGTVSLDPPAGTYNSGQVVTVTATSASGWVFDSWSGDLSGSTNPESITMNSDNNVTATFTQTGGDGQVVHEETRTGGSTSSATVSTSSNLTGASGHLYLAAIATKNRVSVNSVSGLGLTWTLVDAQCAGRNQTGVEVWMAQGTPSGNGAVTATLDSEPTSAVIAVSRYSGVDANDPVGNVISGNTNGLDGACSGGSDNASYSFNLTTTVSGALAYGAAAMRAKTHTPGAGYTERGEVITGSGGSAASVAVIDKTVSSPSTVAVNGSFSSSVDWAMVGAEIKPQVSVTLTKNLPVEGPAMVAAAPAPNEFKLNQNYPNPFNPTTMISYSLPAASHVRLAVYDIIGRTVAVLVDAAQNAGMHMQTWNGLDARGNQVASGTYYYRIEAGTHKQTFRMTLVR